MPKFIVECEWTEHGRFIVEADTLQEAILQVEENDNDAFPLRVAEGSYVDDTFKVFPDECKELD